MIDKKELVRAVKVWNKEHKVGTDYNIPTDMEDRDMMEKFVDALNKANESGEDLPEKCIDVYNSDWLQEAMAVDIEGTEEETTNEKEENEMTEEKAVEIGKEEETEIVVVEEKEAKEKPKKKANSKKAKSKEAELEKETVSTVGTKRGSKKEQIKEAKETAKKKAEEKEAGTGKGKKTGPRGVGVIASILEAIKTKGPIDKKGILDYLVKKFPDRESDSMGKTINAQIGGKKPTKRLEEERKVKLIIKDDKYSVK